MAKWRRREGTGLGQKGEVRKRVRQGIVCCRVDIEEKSLTSPSHKASSGGTLSRGGSSSRAQVSRGGRELSGRGGGSGTTLGTSGSTG